MASGEYDVVIIGGGVMGCATAYYLLKGDAQLRVAVVEKDSGYARASTTLSDGNTRVQFNVKENIQMSLYGLEVLERFAEEMEVDGEKPDVAFRRQGNLFIVDEASRKEAEDGLALQRALGCEVDWLTPDEVQDVFPLYNLTDCVAGTLGRQDGTMSPWAILLGYRKKAIALGAVFFEDEVVAIGTSGNRVTGVTLASGDPLRSPTVVNAAGPWAAQLARQAGIDLPVLPVKRQVTVIRTTARPKGILPGVFFPSGLYVFHEGEGVFTVGKSLPGDPVTLDDFAWERETFEAQLWPELVDLMPEFDQLKASRGWAGLYEVNTLDGNAILGEWAPLGGFYLANGFSGHGFQQCHAVGRYLSELILGRAPSLDLSIFSPQRILDNTPVFESARRIV